MLVTLEPLLPWKNSYWDHLSLLNVSMLGKVPMINLILLQLEYFYLRDYGSF